MWYLLGIQSNITQEMINIFRENRQTVFLKDKNLKKKYEEYLNTDLIPQKYKNDKSYYDGYKSLREKNSVKLNEFSKDIQIDEMLVEKINKFFTREVSIVFFC